MIDRPYEFSLTDSGTGSSSESKRIILSTWPPADDFPIISMTDGTPVSYFRDPIWNLSHWTNKRLYLNFSMYSSERVDAVSSSNINTLKLIIAWWLWRYPHYTNMESLRSSFYALGGLIRACSAEGMLVTDLGKSKSMIDRYKGCKTSLLNTLIFCCHHIYTFRTQLGFYILSPNQIRSLSNQASQQDIRQTSYIPTRIWRYQESRLKEFLNDFSQHEKQIESCYLEALDLYISHFGAHGAYDSVIRKKLHGPFFRLSGSPFSDLARRHGIFELLQKWVVGPTGTMNSKGRGVRVLSSYLTLASRVSLLYILHFTVMRVNEAWSLRCDCLKSEEDKRFGIFWTICGETTKTIHDSDARWVTSARVQPAIKQCATISKLRIEAGLRNPNKNISEKIVSNPFLITACYEPWMNEQYDDEDEYMRKRYSGLGQLIAGYPLLFNSEEMEIQSADLRIAKLLTPTLDESIYQIGKPWHLTWHQFRRTGAINYQASGLVSEGSLQYDLKHQSNIQTLYYSQGFSELRFSLNAQLEYVNSLYEVRAANVNAILADRFQSPHGQKRKKALVTHITTSEVDGLMKVTGKDFPPIRDIILGVCMSGAPCPYGGIDNIKHCGGGTNGAPCPDLLWDKEKLAPIRVLAAELDDLLRDVPAGSPYAQSLTAQIASANRAIASIRLLE